MKRRGLTVIETLIAATLFLISVVVLVGMYPSSARASRQAQGHLLATYLAERELEIVRAQDYAQVVDTDNDYQMEVENNGAKHTIDFKTKVRVKEIRPNLKSVIVEVSYLGPDYFNRQLKMETYVSFY